jgi:hypothetical protein
MPDGGRDRLRSTRRRRLFSAGPPVDIEQSVDPGRAPRTGDRHRPMTDPPGSPDFTALVLRSPRPIARSDRSLLDGTVFAFPQGEATREGPRSPNGRARWRYPIRPEQTETLRIPTVDRREGCGCRPAPRGSASPARPRESSARIPPPPPSTPYPHPGQLAPVVRPVPMRRGASPLPERSPDGPDSTVAGSRPKNRGRRRPSRTRTPTHRAVTPRRPGRRPNGSSSCDWRRHHPPERPR